MSLESVVVLDAGSDTFKAGLCDSLTSEEEPSVITPSAVRNSLAGSPAGSLQAAHATDDRHIASAVIRAVDARVVVDWDAYEAILDDILYAKLGWQIGEEGALLASEALFVSRDEREKLAQLVFEHNNVAGFFYCSQAILSLYAVGKVSGSVVDFGHTTTDIATAFEGQLISPSSSRLDFGMRNVSQHLQQLLEGGRALGEVALDTLRDAIIRVSESAEDAREVLLKGEAAPSQEHMLPDGQKIEVKSEGVELGECLMDGRRLGLDIPPTASALLAASTSVLEAATRKAVLESLVVCGGGSSVEGLPQRLLRDLRLSLPPSANPSLTLAPEYAPPKMLQNAAWTGGAILSKMVFAQNQHVSKGDYDEQGPGVIHQKC